MPLSITTYTLGSLENNTYLLTDSDQHAAVIDPPLGSEKLAEILNERGLKLEYILLTHAHFDHLAGINTLAETCEIPPKVFLHPADLPLWRNRGLAGTFGIDLILPIEPDTVLSSQEVIDFHGHRIEVHHAPGHSPGHVIFYLPQQNCAVCGDVIFKNGIGRTDLPGEDYATLINSIQTRVFTLPAETLLYPGHGPMTTVVDEKYNNPFLV